MRRLLAELSGATPRTALIVLTLALGLVAWADTKPTALKMRSVAGISVGSELDRARELLEKIGKGSGGEEEEREEQGSVKEAWTLTSTDFQTIAYKADAKERINWVTGWVRPGKEIAFAEIGDLSQAARSQPTEAIWNVKGPEGSFRVIARGKDGKASIITMISLEHPRILP